MTAATPPDEPYSESAPVALAPGSPRPGLITAAGITLIALGILTLLLATILMFGALFFAGAVGDSGFGINMPRFAGSLGAFAGIFIFVVLIVLGFGILQVVSGFSVLGGRGWARIAGIVVAVIAGVLALAGVGNGGGDVVSLALAVANVFVIYAFATTGPWFAR